MVPKLDAVQSMFITLSTAHQPMSVFKPAFLETINALSKKQQTSVSLREMVQYGRIPQPVKLFRGSQFLLHELPIRLAHRVVELDNLPHDLSKMPSVARVREWYTQSCSELLEFKSKSATDRPRTLFNYRNGLLR